MKMYSFFLFLFFLPLAATDELVKEAARAWQITDLQLISDSSAKLYKGKKEQKDTCIKIFDVNPITAQQVCSLHEKIYEKGLHIPKIVALENQKLSLTLSDQQTEATAFQWIPLHPIQASQIGNPLLQRIGVMLAALHQAGKEIIDEGCQFDILEKRNWKKRVGLSVHQIQKFHLDSTPVQECAKLLPILQNLPQDPENFGWTHSDAHLGNFLVDDTGQVWIIDLDLIEKKLVHL